MQTADSIEARNSEDSKDAGNSTNNSESKAPWLKPYQFQPGQSGNPNGRPKKDTARDIAQQIFENNPEAVYRALGKALLKGNAYAFKELAERAYGKLVERKELTGANGGPIETREVSDADLSQRISELERDLGLTAAIDEAGRSGIAAAGNGKANGKAEVAEVLPR